MTKDEFGEIHEVWAELKAIFDEIDGLNNTVKNTGTESFGTIAGQTASAH